MDFKKISAAVTVVLTAFSMGQSVFAEQLSASVSKITVTPSEQLGKISPYIYGVNNGADLNSVSAKSIRLGGNRMSAYNWENNMSNAGSDYYHTSDMYLITDIPDEFKRVPGGPALALSSEAQTHNISYTLLTLQMLGYVTSSKRGRVTAENAATSDYWVEVRNRKDSELSLEPDKNDGAVYTDEYLNYLSDKIGKSDSATGIKAFALDNEPALWKHTHSLVQHGDLSCSELIVKSAELASVVKEADPGAEVFGPSLFGYSAFDSFAGAPDWQKLKADNGYRWFIDYYLDEMKKAGNSSGKRLLDVLDIHYYTEAKGECGERSCSHYDNDGCIKARLDSVRSLYDENYRENSWITDTGAEFFPLLPNIQQSIDNYYPGTKLAFTEYNFGGGDHISGAVAEADMLGIFAEYGVYFAAIWSFENNQYQLSAINMFTNYDGNGSGFGDTLVKSEYENGDISVYSSTDSENDGTVKIIVTNRSLYDEMPVEISISSDNAYENAEVYSLYGDSAEIRAMPAVEKIEGNSFGYVIPPLSVTEFVVKKPAENVSESNSAEGFKTKKALPVIAGIAGVGAIAAAAILIGKKRK
ncbi:MAG: glycoside hydrolase [Oscillospiraceae bacterium]|nr:glycoside hydrolase [Oscillospiraceae bacterium]